jgi:hypothetical protein
MPWNPSTETIQSAIDNWRSEADENISLMAAGRSAYGPSVSWLPHLWINHLDALEMVTKSLCDVIAAVCPQVNQATFWEVHQQARLWNDHGRDPSAVLRAQSHRQIAETEFTRVRRTLEEKTAAGASSDPLKVTLGVLSRALAKMVEFVATQEGRRAHVDDITRHVDGIKSQGSVCARRKTVRTRFERARRLMEAEKTPFVIGIDDLVLFLEPRS